MPINGATSVDWPINPPNDGRDKKSRSGFLDSVLNIGSNPNHWTNTYRLIKRPANAIHAIIASISLFLKCKLAVVHNKRKDINT